ncbi:MAG: nicotinate-nucleotide adenylyltransferase [Anaerolineales bacterium]|jgi:nicotinate-nucleotide adenylyltransferase|nr:nicotinate-nucleotide adenylyltransferase [Anaerolineales bacterium]
MRIGVYGGTFDPPHIAHLILASEACAQLALDQVYWLLTPVSPFKRGKVSTPLEMRLAMLQAAIADNPQFVLCRVDIDRPAPHYAADSLELLRQQHADAEWIYLMGGDSLRDLPSWHAPERLLGACHSVGVMRRPGTQIDQEDLYARLPALDDKLVWIDVPLMDISASHIRHLARTGGSFRYYVPPAVYEIILAHKLYMAARAESE